MGREVTDPAKSCNWKPEMFELFRDVIILARDREMRNGRELYRIRTKNLNWNNRMIFVPDSKIGSARNCLIPRTRQLADIESQGE